MVRRTDQGIPACQREKNLRYARGQRDDPQLAVDRDCGVGHFGRTRISRVLRRPNRSLKGLSKDSSTYCSLCSPRLALLLLDPRPGRHALTVVMLHLAHLGDEIGCLNESAGEPTDR